MSRSEPTGDAVALAPLIRRLAEQTDSRHLPAKTTLFHQGDAVRDIFVVATGRVQLQRHTIEGVRLTLQTARAGELLAAASLFATHYHCDAVADAPSHVHVFSRRVIREALEARPDLARSLMATLATQVIELRTRLELRNIRSARQRVWHHLALAADSDRRIATPEPLTYMAQVVGLTPEALYRTLAALERDGVINRTPGMIRIMRKDGWPMPYPQP